MLPKPVSAIAGVRSPRSFRCRSSSKPSIRGMTRSETMTSALKAVSRSSASCPSAATCVSKAQSESMAAKAVRWRSSSSTMRIRPETAGARACGRHYAECLFRVEWLGEHIKASKVQHLRPKRLGDGIDSSGWPLMLMDFLSGMPHIESLGF